MTVTRAPFHQVTGVIADALGTAETSHAPMRKDHLFVAGVIMGKLDAAGYAVVRALDDPAYPDFVAPPPAPPPNPRGKR